VYVRERERSRERSVIFKDTVICKVEVNAHKTKYMTVFRDQNAGRIYSMKMDNSPI